MFSRSIKKKLINDKNDQVSKLVSSSIKLRDIVERNIDENRIIKDEEIIRLPFIIVEYSGDKKSNVFVNLFRLTFFRMIIRLS